ncbi:PIG-L deacetylase family protein [Polynucleobacter hallstattensis]|uniref:PIG-L deacetylase family protein n=1 Tax=Polynucleobacter hallstattensis TaxID=1855586 RepID=UPI001C0BE34D|nr:PIG-L family deacetylase [Polynucleobacter hallstattensis]MBU3560601.1 PIG-L family deacetylase [Polynucleobacter hallstattensis]
MKNISFFLFAHQDDEFAVYEEIYTSILEGKVVYCVYMTRGVKGAYSSHTRNQESISVLTHLGVKIDNIIFAGDILSIDDGDLFKSMDKGYEWIHAFLREYGPNITAFMPSWEGGHPDHDCLHVISNRALENRSNLNESYQYPLYNRVNCRGPFFRVLYPIYANGKIILRRIPWKRRFQYLHYLTLYESQRKSWIGLLPFTLLHYIVNGTQILQSNSPISTIRRPHIGTLYYEYRKFNSWVVVSNNINIFLKIYPSLLRD